MGGAIFTVLALAGLLKQDRHNTPRAEISGTHLSKSDTCNCQVENRKRWNIRQAVNLNNFNGGFPSYASAFSTDTRLLFTFRVSYILGKIKRKYLETLK